MIRLLAGIIFFLLTFMPVSFAQEESALGKAMNIEYKEISIGGNTQIKQIIDVQLLNGESKNSNIQLENILSGNPYYDINVTQGDKIVLHIDSDNDERNYFVADIYRITVPIVLAMVFCGLVLYVGRRKGLNSLISIFFTIGMIYWILRPAILWGLSPLLITLLISLLSTVVTMFFVGGINRKSLSATLGTVAALTVAGVASLLAIKSARLTGFTDETTLFLYSSHPELDFTSIAASVMILAALGAVMDVAMSIASTINEIHSKTPALTKKELFEAGMNVGRDIIGTMANTLILVYMGSALPLLLLSADIDGFKFFNLNSVVTEISSAIIGSIALLLCVPFTAFIAAYFSKLSNEKLEKYDIISSVFRKKE